MRYLLISLLLGVFNVGFSQDTIQIPSNELEEFFLAIDTLRYQDSIKTSLVEELNFQISLMQESSHYDSLIIYYKNEEIQLLNTQLDLYKNYVDQEDKWYKKQWVGVVGGFIGTITLINTINYTLPD
jgi:hypothetical protein